MFFLKDLIQALAMRRTRLRSARRASRADILDVQRKRLSHLLEHAARYSPFYRQRWGGHVPGPEDLSRLEPIDKSLLLEHYDEILTVNDLDLASARKWLARSSRDLSGRHILCATSGTTGQPVVIPYTRRDWREGMAYVIRSAELAMEGVLGRRGGLFSLMRERPKIAGISTLNPIHVSTRLTKSFQTKLVSNLLLSASTPIEQQIEQLNHFQPTVLCGYPSAIYPLSRAAIDGVLHFQPKLIITGGETVSTALRRRVREVWGLDIFDFYGLAETLIIAGECLAHQGLHIYEDAVVLEVVDEKGRAVPAGEPGDKVLLTNLFNRTLPLIRYEVGDMLTLSHDSCPCGLPFHRIVSVEGRREELLALRRTDGEKVEVHPFVIESPLEEMPEILQFQIIGASGGRVRIIVVPDARVEDAAARTTEAVASVLSPLGVDPGVVEVQTATSITSKRGSTDKLLHVKNG